MTAPAKPVDLAAIRMRFASLARPDATVERDAAAMADEIEALRDILREAIDDEDSMGTWVERARALLPPS